MKTKKEFEEALNPILQELEDFRLNELQAAKNAQIYYIIPAILVIFTIPFYWKVSPAMALILALIALAVGFYIATEIVSKSAVNFDWKFKKQALSTFVNALYPQASYSYEKKIPAKTFLSSELFQQANEYEGEDYFFGETQKGFKFQFSEVDVWVGDNHNDPNALFEGIFFEIETPHNFQTRVFVLPRVKKSRKKKKKEDEQLSLQGLTATGELLSIDNLNPKFEKYFEIYSHSKEMAFHLLTPKIIEGILAIKKNWKVSPKISFIDNKIFVALDTPHDLFVTNIHTTLLENEKIIHQMYEELSLCFDVVELLGQPIETSFKEKNTASVSTTVSLDEPDDDAIDFSIDLDLER